MLVQARKKTSMIRNCFVITTINWKLLMVFWMMFHLNGKKHTVNSNVHREQSYREIDCILLECFHYSLVDVINEFANVMGYVSKCRWYVVLNPCHLAIEELVLNFNYVPLVIFFYGAARLRPVFTTFGT